MSLLSIVSLRDDFGGASGAEADSLVTTGHSLVALHDATFLLGPAFCAGLGNGILLGYLMYKSGLVPRRLAMLGLIGGPLAFLSATLVLFGAYEQLSGSVVPRHTPRDRLGSLLDDLAHRQGVPAVADPLRGGDGPDSVPRIMR